MNNRLRDLREKKHFTQLKVGMQAEIDQSNYSKIEREERFLTMEQAKRLAILFNTSIDYLVELTDDENPYPRRKKVKSTI